MDGGRSSGGLPVTKLKLTVVALVAVSAALVSVQVDASPVSVGVALVAGTVVGIVLVWLAFPDVNDETRERIRR